LVWYSLAGRRRKEHLSLARSSPLGAQCYVTELYMVCCPARGQPYPQARVAARAKCFWRSREQPQPSINLFLKSQGRLSQGMQLHGSPKDTKALHPSKGLKMQLALMHVLGEGKQNAKGAHGGGDNASSQSLCSATSAWLPQLQLAYSWGRTCPWRRIKTFEGRKVRREFLSLRCLKMDPVRLLWIRAKCSPKKVQI